MTYDEFKLKLDEIPFVELDLPIAQWYLLTENEDYDPENFSQEIEDREKYSPFYNTFVNLEDCICISDNSDIWKKNHSKKVLCKAYSYVNTCCDRRNEETSKCIYDKEAKKCLLKAVKEITDKGLNVVGCTYGSIRDEKFFNNIKNN